MENNIEQLKSEIAGLVLITTEQTNTMKQMNENCWLLLDRIQKIEAKIETLQYGQIKPVTDAEFENENNVVSEVINQLNS